MATVTVKFEDPNPLGKVTSYNISVSDAYGVPFHKASMAAPTSTTSPSREYKGLVSIPAALPIAVTIVAVNNGVESDPAVYASNADKPSVVTIKNLTIA